MWLVVNRTGFAIERTWVQDRDANKIWLVVIKATFDVLTDGSCGLAAEQVPVLRMPRHVAEPERSSLIYESDLAGPKPCTDVLLHGSAWAPQDKPVTSLDASLTVGPIRKRVRVFGDRVWDRGIGGGISASSPLPFESMPITYERAYGGWDRSAPDPLNHRLDERNPVGTGHAIREEGCVGKQLPNLERADQLIGSWKDRPVPVGFNAIACHWSPRRELAGTYDAAWRAQRFPLWAEDFDPRYHNCAPRDQQTEGFLLGGEPVDLVNLSPHGRISFRLPKVELDVHTRFGHERVEHQAQLCTVIVEPDVPRVMLCWQTTLMCNRRVDELDATIVAERTVV